MLSSMMKSFDFITLAYLLKLKGVFTEVDLLELRQVAQITSKLIEKECITKKEFKDERFKIIELIHELVRIYNTKDIRRLDDLREKYLVEFSQVFEEFEKTFNV
jgi:hypothetical protein